MQPGASLKNWHFVKLRVISLINLYKLILHSILNNNLNNLFFPIWAYSLWYCTVNLTKGKFIWTKPDFLIIFNGKLNYINASYFVFQFLKCFKLKGQLFKGTLFSISTFSLIKLIPVFLFQSIIGLLTKSRENKKILV